MIGVFASFALANDPNEKLLAIGCSSAIFLDATVVRMLVVPATMALFDRKAWWLPRWLDRLLPNVDVEGAHLMEHLAVTLPAASFASELSFTAATRLADRPGTGAGLDGRDLWSLVSRVLGSRPSAPPAGCRFGAGDARRTCGASAAPLIDGRVGLPATIAAESRRAGGRLRRCGEFRLS